MITQTTEQGLRDLGANLNYMRFVAKGVEADSMHNNSLQQITTRVVDPLSNVTLPTPDQAFFQTLRPDANLNTPGIAEAGGAGLVASVINADYGKLTANFRAIEERAESDLISKPDILVANGVPAIIRAGEQIPYQDMVTPPTIPGYPPPVATQLNVVWKDVGVNMSMTPTILPNNSVQLTISELNVSDIQRYDNVRGIDLPVFSKRSQTGVVMVANGETLVIGGLWTRVERKTERRVPVLGKIPILGIPFRGRKSTVNNMYLSIFVKPTIVDLRKMTEGSMDALHFWREHKWENLKRIDKEVEAMQNGL
jgi:type II secretory pathway component GspD/PulD (secretin)